MIEVSQSILNLKSYVPGKSIEEIQRTYGLQEIIKLASNENPLGPSPMAVAAIQNELNQIHRYPDGSYFSLKKTLSEHFHIEPESIACGNGSNELIDLLIRIFCTPNDKILISEASFVAYKVCAEASRVGVTEVKLNPDYSISPELLIQSWAHHKIIFIPNPNNPTGLYLNAQQILKILENFGNNDQCLIVMDEAYVEFTRANDYLESLGLLKHFKNLIVLRTFAKAYGLAGLRVGAIFAAPQIIQLIERVRNPFNVNSLAAVAVTAALRDKEFLKKSQQVVWKGLDQIYKGLDQLGLKYCESQGNFVFFDTEMDAQIVFEELLKRGIILRPVKNYGFSTHLRMSVGLENENEKVLETLKEIL